MDRLSGYILPLKKLLSDDKSEIIVTIGNKVEPVHELETNRSYVIPYFQREIRWKADNVNELIDDIKRKEKHLGNMILSQRGAVYSVIDGQQRITVLLMILLYIRKKFHDKIEMYSTCELAVESFKGFSLALKESFSDGVLAKEEYINSDKLQQRDSYLDIWKTISQSVTLNNQRTAKDFLENLGNCNVNVVLSKTSDLDDDISHFIDVNLKGLMLDDEDVFKGYLFKNDKSKEIREEWFAFKKNVVMLRECKVEYPLMSLLEHFFLCDLYTVNDFEGLQFNSDLRLGREFTTAEDIPTTYRTKTHLVEVVNDKSYFLTAFRNLNKVISVFNMFASNESLSDDIKRVLSGAGNKVDNDEQKVIHNLLSKILKDKNSLPKALVMKFVVCVLLSDTRTKNDIKKFYGVFCLSTLFNIFENEKSMEIFSSILKSSNSEWHLEIIQKIRTRYVSSKHTQARLFSAIKQPKGESYVDYQYRCKSLAVIYNYFRIEDSCVVCKPVDKAMLYLTDSNSFSTEHFIISKSDTMLIHDDTSYPLPVEIKKYHANIFNFIFIQRGVNKDKCCNYWLPKKMQILKSENINCEYSQMIIANLAELSNRMEEVLNRDYGDTKTRLDSFFLRDFKEAYLNYARAALDAIMDKLMTSNGDKN